MKHLKRSFFIFISLIIFSFCKEDVFITDENARLEFSTDTVFFDTVFTTIGTTTQWLKVYNPHNKSINITRVYLAGGNNSVFRMNVDGKPAREVKDKKVAPKDSLFILIEATIDPKNANLPVFVKDSIVFVTNNNIQDVKLAAWGQDVHYFRDRVIKSQVWNNDKPYLIYNNLVVDSNEVLTINEGAMVYLHWRSSLVVLGTLVINGTHESPVVFQGDRLEEYYQDVAGQWWAIALIYGSKNNKINHLVVKNATIGLQVGVPCQEQVDEVEISNTIIQNSSAFGLYAIGARIRMYNTLICNSGLSNFYVQKGGDYQVYHSTIANRSSSKYPSVILSDFTECIFIGNNFKDTSETLTGTLEQALFINSIVYGGQKSELALIRKNEEGFQYKFDNCLLKLVRDSFDTNNPVYFENNIYNTDPKFIEPAKHNFMLDTTSPAIDKGNRALIESILLLKTDLNNNDRLIDLAPDLGAYERKDDD